MTNGRIIEGNTEYSGFSDLSPATYFCQSDPKTPMNVGEPWATIGWAANLPIDSMRVFHGAGKIKTENKAGQYSNMATTVWWIARSGDMQGLCASAELKSASHCIRNLGNPYAEKKARLRSQHFIFSRSRMGSEWSRCSCEGGSRGPASAIRNFGSGAGPSKMSSLWRN